MKTTNKNTLVKKIEKLIAKKELYRNSNMYFWLTDLSKGETKFRPVYTSGSSWKYSTLNDVTKPFTLLLEKLGIEFEYSNDAPRGGKTGALITITTKVKQN